MSHLLPNLSSKEEIDRVIRTTSDLVLVLRFGRENDGVCMQLDDIVSWQLALLFSNTGDMYI